MQEVASNTFATGITTDIHPLSMPTTSMTDALNATCLTFNGNEMLLQNDMGNTLIQDSTTGNIMGLSDGFVPVGMKEHGGILYIASYNPKTKISELGTIPSPVVNYTYRDEPYTIETWQDSQKKYIIDNIIKTGTPEDFTNTDWYNSASMVICNQHRFAVGEQFLVAMTLTESRVTRINFNDDTYRTTATVKSGSGSAQTGTPDGFYGAKKTSREIPMVSYFDDAYKITGYFDCMLETKTSNSSDTVTLTDISNTPINYYVNSSSEQKPSKYWFISDMADDDSLNTDYCQADHSYISYPNILPGYLYIKFTANVKLESVENFTCYFYDEY